MAGQDVREAAAVIAAGGIGSRMGGDLPKQFMTLRGTPVLALTVARFLQVDGLGTVVVVVPAGYREAAAALLRDFLPAGSGERILLVNGGATRQESVRAGLQALPPQTATVLVHDGARPFVTADIIVRCLREAKLKGAAIAAVPVRDTLKQADLDRQVLATVDRSGLWQAQTPQGARVDLLRRAYDLADRDGFQGTDEASLLEHAGIPVAIVEGSEGNFKITRPDDFALAEALTQGKLMLKIGHGFDAHRLVADRPLILGGVHIPFELGLDGHSDADALTHALIDALLGAMGEGDIGRHFPDSDQRYKNISSLLLLVNVATLLRKKNLGLGNADITVVCQRPKLAPYIPAMRENLARACAVSPEALNIKATTTERMGYTGRGEGIAAHAVALLHTLSCLNAMKITIDRERLAADFVLLCETDSPSREEGAIAALLRTMFAELGADEILEDDSATATGSETGNLLIRFAGQASLEPVFLNCHMDTVEPGRGVKVHREGDTFFSSGGTILGSDDKSGIAAILEAVRCIRENSLAHRPLEVILTTCEEIGLLGAKSLDPAMVRARIGYALDSTGFGTVIIGAPAANRLEIAVRGVAAHAGLHPEWGVNAIALAARGLNAAPLGRIDEESTVNFGTIQGGTATNIVPDQVTIRGEARSHSTATLDRLTREVENAFARAVADWRDPTGEAKGRPEMSFTATPDFPAMRLDRNDPAIRLIDRAAASIGLQLEYKIAGGGSDANIFNGHGLQTAIIATGMTHVHSTDEQVDLQDMVDLARMLIALLT